jgi:pilus assembly protein Flp/PilA
MHLLPRLIAFAADRRGATSIEYALIASGVSMAVVVVVNGLGVSVGTLYAAVGNVLQ